MDSADDPIDLDETGSSNGLFSMSATENAEVVTPGVQLGGDGLWSVSAKVDEAPQPDQVTDSDPEVGSDPEAGTGYGISEEDIEEVQGEIVDSPEAPGSQDRGWEESEFGHADASTGSDPDGIWDLTDDQHDSDGKDQAQNGSYEEQYEDDFDDFDDWDDGMNGNGNRPTDSVGSVFTAEPVDRSDDVVDEPDVIDDDGFPVNDALSSSLFSSGGTVGGATSAAFGGTGAQYFTPAGNPASGGGLWESTDDVTPRAARGEPLRSDPLWEPTDAAPGAQGVPDSHLSYSDHGGFDDEESPGYEAAILQLHPQDRERASVALSVAGALLQEGEPVLGVVTGQMLGRPAAVVVTSGRVVVVNDRRWQPVVDIYKIEAALRVRGRHDRNIAALSFSNDWSLSMVDGITEVSLAMDLAERIRLIADT